MAFTNPILQALSYLRERDSAASISISGNTRLAPCEPTFLLDIFPENLFSLLSISLIDHMGINPFTKL